METISVSVDTLQEYPGNARKGDIDKIVESLKINGQYKPIVVQKSTNYVLVGNHTLKAIKKLGWDHVDIIELDVDEVSAKRIILADNRTSDVSSYDFNLLNSMLTSLPDLGGTGYNQINLSELASTVNAFNIELGVNDMGSKGLGNPIIHYDIIFETEEQQATFYKLVKFLKGKYPDAGSVGERITMWIESNKYD